MSEPKRVLQILSSTQRAGVQMMVMNLYREVDRDKLQFDFVVHDLGEHDLDQEIEALGGRIFRIPLLTKIGIRKFVDTIRQIIVENGPYIAVHTHTDYQGGFGAMAAKKAGVRKRLCHAHLDTRHMHSPVFLAKKRFGRFVIRLYTTQRCACSRYAAIALYGNRAVKKNLVKIINNGIDLDNYESYDPEFKMKLFDKYHLDENTKIIGNVARLSLVKNQSYILDLAAEAKKRGLNYLFVFVGSGDMSEMLHNKQHQLELDASTVFLGTRDDVPQVMQCFDVFILPSLAEGLPLTVLEAQAAGTQVIAAQCVPLEADMGLGLFHRLSIDAGIDAWLQEIDAALLSERPDTDHRIAAIRAKGYDARRNVDEIMTLYGAEN